MKRLVTIPFSHYCEKARWALDFAGMTYVEEKHLPLLHFPAKWARRARTLPVLVTPHGTLRDSTAIVEWVDRVATPLYPQSDDDRRRVVELVAAFDAELGPATRLLAYHYGLADVGVLRTWVAPSLTRAQRLVFVPVMKRARPLVRRFYGISERTASEAEEAVKRAFAKADAVLAESPYLSGASFGAADITFAALAAPALLPSRHPAYPEGLDVLTPQLRGLAEGLRATRAGQHALRMYREHRHAR